MIATTGFWCGVNCPHVTAAITFQGSYSLVEDIQGAGRMGLSKNGFGDLMYITIRRDNLASYM
jgi:hypothetical protein